MPREMTNLPIWDEVDRRLRCIEGHVRGVRRMVGEDRPAIEVIQQLHAIQGSIQVIRKLLFKEHLATCLQRDHGPACSDHHLHEALDQLLPFYE